MTLLLAACGQPQTADPSSVTFKLSTSDQSSSITTQGAPFDPTTGATSIETLRVTVRNADDQIINFNVAGSVYTADPAGSAAYVTLAKTVPNGGLEVATVVLPSAGNPYSFESFGYASVTGPVIAYAKQTQPVTESSTVLLLPVSVLGAAELAPRFPTTIVAPGSVLDIMLTVSANGHPALQVPLGDFTAQYAAVVGATTLSSSNRGIRLQIPSDCVDTLTIGGTVAGLVETSGTYPTGSLDMNAGAGLQLGCPPMVTGGVAFDTEPPTLTLDSHNSATGLVRGSADDNYGIAKVQLFDGPVLLASTEASETGPTVSLIAFINGTTEFRTTLTAAPLGGIAAVAFDTSGNQSTSVELASLGRVYVDASHTGTQTGSQTQPFTSIQAALDVVADQGVVVVAAGTYVEQLSISKNVDLQGAGAGATIVRGPSVWQPVDSFGGVGRYAIVDVSGAGITANLTGLTVSGPFGTPSGNGGCGAMFGVRVKEATLNLSDAAVVDVKLEPFDGGSDCGASIQVGSLNDGFTGTANLTNVEVVGYQKNGVRVERSGSTLTVVDSSVTGAGAIGSGGPAQNGILVVDGASATISGSAISDNNYTESTWNAVGLLVDLSAGVVVENTTFSGNKTGLYLARSSASFTVRNNTFDADGVPGWHIINYLSGDIDAVTGNVFDGVSPATASLTQLFDIERTIYHGADNSAYGLVRVVPGSAYVESSANPAAAIASTAAGDTVYVEPGDYTSRGTITIPANRPHLTLSGAGATVERLSVEAAGATISGFAVAVAQTSQAAAVTVKAPDVTLMDLAISNSASFEADAVLGTLGYGVHVERGSTASGFTMDGGSISNFTYGIFNDTALAMMTSFSGVSINDVTLTDITWKGMYFEVLDDAVISGVSMSNVGWYGGGKGSGLQGRWGAGIDLNLKYDDYENITLSDVTATDTGWSYGLSTDTTIATGVRGADSDPNGAAITIKARNDGSYAGNPATLSNIVLDGFTVSESLVGVRFGEPKLGVPAVDNEHVGAVIKNSVLSTPTTAWVAGATAYSVVNVSVSDVTATENNVIEAPVWDVNDDATRGEVVLN